MTKLAAIRDSAREYAASFDASLVTCTEAAGLAREAAALEAIAASIKARAAARAGLARETGTSVGQAKQMLTTGAALESLPRLAAAAASSRARA